MHPKIALLVAGAGIQAVVAQTSLWIPGFDPQALSADVIGVDSAKGRTTYRIQRGASTAANDDESGFTGTFTLVEGTDYASYNLAQGDVSMTYDCSISGSLGICSGADGSTTATATETIKPFLVQGGATLTNADSQPTAGNPTNTGSGGAKASGNTAGTGTNTGTGAIPGKTNNAAFSGRQFTSAGVVVGAVGVVLSLSL